MQQRPFALPRDLPQPDPLAAYFKTALTIAVSGLRNDERVDHVARNLFQGDRDLELVQRAASVPATTTTAAWAGLFSATTVGPFLKSLAPRSAAAQLFEAGLVLSLDGIGQVNLPRGQGPSAPQPVFVVEGEPIKVSQGALTTVALGPAKKLAYIAALTSELAELSAEPATEILRNSMVEASALALDLAVWSTAAASASRPAGILNGVTPITPTAGGGQAAVLADLKALIAAIDLAGLGREVWLFVSPELIAPLAVFAPTFPLRVVPTPVLPVGTVVAIEVGAIAAGFSGLPQIDISTQSLLHFEDTTPAQIGTVGTPNVVAAPTRSLWQTSTTALRCIVRCAWAVRAPGAVQVINSATW